MHHGPAAPEPASEPPPAAWRPAPADLGLALVFMALAGVGSFLGSGQLDARLLSDATMDVWFEADMSRIVEIATNRWAINDRAPAHPIFALLVVPPVYVLRLAGLDPWAAVRVCFAVLAAVSAGLLFAILRLFDGRRLDAALFTLVGMTSASAVLWGPIPETHTLAQPTILLAILVVAVSGHRAVPSLLEVAASAATLGITVTNWMAGLLAAIVRHPWRRALQLSVNALALVVVLWVVQTRLVPASPFFIGTYRTGGHVLAAEAGGILGVARAFFLHSIVAPVITVVDRPGAGEWPIMLFQPSAAGSTGLAGMVALILWGGLLLAGAWAVIASRGLVRARIFLLLLVAGQFTLFVLFGNETFLYAPTFAPILVVLVGLAARTRVRVPVLAAAALLVVVNGANSLAQWRGATRFFTSFASFEHAPGAIEEHLPAGPRQVRHEGFPIRLREPGARRLETGLVAWAGGFRPGHDQFLLSYWIVDRRGALRFAAEELPDSLVDARVEAGPDSTVERVVVTTPYYRATWTVIGERHWDLRLAVSDSVRLVLVLRGTGPFRAPLRDLEWSARRGTLTLNRQWQLQAGRPVSMARMSDETRPGWMTSWVEVDRIHVPSGWAAARIEVGRGAHSFRLRDTDSEPILDRIVGTIPARRSPGPT